MKKYDFYLVSSNGLKPSFSSSNDVITQGRDVQFDQFGKWFPSRTQTQLLQAAVKDAKERYQRWIKNLNAFDECLAKEYAEENKDALKAFLSTLSPEEKQAYLN